MTIEKYRERHISSGQWGWRQRLSVGSFNVSLSPRQLRTVSAQVSIGTLNPKTGTGVLFFFPTISFAFSPLYKLYKKKKELNVATIGHYYQI